VGAEDINGGTQHLAFGGRRSGEKQGDIIRNSTQKSGLIVKEMEDDGIDLSIPGTKRCRKPSNQNLTFPLDPLDAYKTLRTPLNFHWV
jgi:hypothetical protein